MAEARPSGAIAPGGTIGILGGGQLGRMTALAAARLGYRTHVLAPESACPAAEVAWRFTAAAYEDEALLAAFARSVDVVTLEFENVPTRALELLERQVPVRPPPHVLAVTQDRLREKTFLRSVGVPTADFAPVTTRAELATAWQRLGRDAILKTARFGYDGKGQARLGAQADLEAAWTSIGAVEAILERRQAFVMEISVVTARAPGGETKSFVPVENRHENLILRRTIAPAGVEPRLAGEAVALAERVAAALDLEGLLAVEMFVTADARLLVNELAPRPHNSGHWTIDACHTSQFEQLVRAVCGLPLGDPAPFAAAEMVNLLGDEASRWASYVAEPGLRLHLYGKREARPGRKMGHVTRIRRLEAAPQAIMSG